MIVDQAGAEQPKQAGAVGGDPMSPTPTIDADLVATLRTLKLGRHHRRRIRPETLGRVVFAAFR